MATRKQVLSREPFCRICRSNGNRLTKAVVVDHINPIHKGGDWWALSNLQPLCKSCHDVKTAGEATSRAFSMVPDWLNVRCKLHVVCGPPGSGKTTYVKEQSAPSDIVLDLDDILMELTGHHGHSRTPSIEAIASAVRIRNERIAAAAQGQTVWLIASAAKDSERRFWKDKGATVTLLNPGHVVCMERVKGRARDYTEAVLRWYRNYGAASASKPAQAEIGLDGWAETD